MTAEEILEYWFQRDRRQWFEKNPALDEEIRARFLPLYEIASRNRLETWMRTPRSCLAQVILLDQFPRNMFRGSAEAFATDPLARAATRVILENAWDKAMTPDERMFAYLPLEHSESLEEADFLNQPGSSF